MNADQVYIRPLMSADAQAMLDLRLANRKFLEPFEPVFPEGHFTLDGQTEALLRTEEQRANGTGFSFGICLKPAGELIGRVSLSNVVRGAWQSCTIGYFLDERQNGRGYVTQAVKQVVGYAFEEVGLHRVQGAVMPRNQASIRVLQKAGFRYEGLAEYYLQIHGVWEHHNIYSITQEHWSVMSGEGLSK